MDIDAQLEALQNDQLDQHFDDVFAIVEQVVSITDASPELRESLIYGCRQYAKRWFLLGYRAAESGLGRMAVMNVARSDT